MTTTPTATQVLVSGEIDFYRFADTAIRAAEHLDAEDTRRADIVNWSATINAALETGHLDTLLGRLAQVRASQPEAITASLSAAAAGAAERLSDEIGTPEEMGPATAITIAGITLAAALRGGKANLHIVSTYDGTGLAITHDLNGTTTLDARFADIGDKHDAHTTVLGALFLVEDMDDALRLVADHLADYDPALTWP